MKIRRLRIDGFGSLKGDFIFSSDRCNLILEPNESGKSTLAAAILAALYGFPRQRATREYPITLKEQHRPWGGGPYAVEMDLTCRDRSYTIRRDFDQDTASVLDGSTGKEITAEFSRAKDSLNFGEALTGLSREDFARCGFVGQREIESLRDAHGLTHALQRIASSQKGDVASGEAIEALERAVNRDYEGMRLGRGKVDTEVKRLEKEIDEVRTEMEEIAARRRASEDKIRRLEEATAQEGRAEAGLTRLDFLHLLAARQEAQAQLEQVRRDEEEIRSCRAEIAELEPYATFPIERLDELKEVRTRVESLQQMRAGSERKVREEIEAALARAEAEMAPLSTVAALSAEEVALTANRQAVLDDLWKQRRSKRSALRREKKRLTRAGVDPGRVTELAAAFSPIEDEERRFLNGYRESVLELKAALSEAERERDRHAQAEGINPSALVPLASARRAEAIALLVGVFGFVMAPVLLLLKNNLAVLASLMVAVVGFIYWVRLRERRPIHGAEEFGSNLQRIQTEIWSREKELAALQEDISNLAARIGYARTDRLVEEFRELETLQEKAAPVAQLATSLQEIQTRYDAAAAEILDLMCRAGRPPARRLVSPRIARSFCDDIERFAAARAKVAALSSERDTARREIAALAEEIETQRARGVTLFRSGLGPEAVFTDLGEAVSRFSEAAGRRERRERLEREILPAALRRIAVPHAERIATLTRELEVLSRQAERAIQQNPSLSGLGAEKSSREYVEERRRLQEEARQTQRERLALSDELGDVLKEYRRDYPGRQALLSSLETAQGRATAFRDAVALATETLRAISKEAYAQWAEILNDRAGGIARRINPNYDELLFDTDLTFTVRDARTGKRLDQAAIDVYFSAGARDQIYLAVRMGLSEYLSAAGARLPFILDDSFATFDDDRFDRAMEFLIDTVGRRHQVIILSCHESRHRFWLEVNSGQRAEKVRVLDLTPLST